MRAWCAVAAAALSAGLLSACATTGSAREAGQVQAEAAFAQRLALLRPAPGFELQGRIAVRGGALSGGLRWVQLPERYTLRVSGPFGAGALLLEGQGRTVHVKSKDVDVTTTEPEALLAERTGWRLPLGALRYWVLGIPAPYAPAELQVDAQGRAASLSQSGWTLRYSDYLAAAPNTPGRVEASLGDWTAIAIVQTLTLSSGTP